MKLKEFAPPRGGGAHPSCPLRSATGINLLFNKIMYVFCCCCCFFQLFAGGDDFTDMLRGLDESTSTQHAGDSKAHRQNIILTP